MSCYVRLYNICHVMLCYITCHVMLCYTTYVMLCYIKYVMLCYITYVSHVMSCYHIRPSLPFRVKISRE